MKLIEIIGDKRRSDVKQWLDWLNNVNALRCRFVDEVGDDPLYYNETASVSLFASGAAIAGALPIAEYVTQKRSVNDFRQKHNGRDDLYVNFGETHWVFEFKQIFRAVPSRMRDQLAAAKLCAKQTDSLPKEANLPKQRGVAVLLIYISDFWPDRVEKYTKNADEFIQTNKEDIDLAVAFDGNEDFGRCYVIFSA